jgi:hypothetical protein
MQFDDQYMSDTDPAELAQRDTLEYGSDDLWMWLTHGGQGEWKQLPAMVAPALGGGRPLEVRRTGHCMFVHESKLYMYGGYYKDGSATSMYCNDFLVLNLHLVLSELSAANLSKSRHCEPFPEAAVVSAEDDDHSASHVLMLRRMLAAVGSTSSIRYMLDDGVDDDDIAALSRTQPHKVATKFKMTQEQALRFVEACTLATKEQQRLSPERDETSEPVEHASICGVRDQDYEQLNQSNQVANSQSYPSAVSGGLKGVLLRRKTISQNPFGNRMHMNSSLTISQFHVGALHVALKSVFFHNSSIDAIKDSAYSGELVVDNSEFFFRLKVLTLKQIGAGTDADVFVILVDSRGRETNEISLDLSKSELVLQNEKIIAAGGHPEQVTIDLFERGSCDSFMIRPLIYDKFRPSDIQSIKGDDC